MGNPANKFAAARQSARQFRAFQPREGALSGILIQKKKGGSYPPFETNFIFLYGWITQAC